MLPKQTPTSFRLPPDIKQGLKEAAGEQRVSVSWLLKEIVRYWLMNRKKQKDKAKEEAS